jgi:hypothetical protein
MSSDLKRLMFDLLWLIIPLGMGVGWFLWSRAFYGESHFLAVTHRFHP